MNYVILQSACGCLALLGRPEAIDLPFITEYSSKDQQSTDYYPLQSEDENYIFVPENVDEMGEPIKFSEVADAPAFNAMSLFIGIQDNGDGTFTNYNFTPQQLLAYLSPYIEKTYTKIYRMGDPEDTVNTAFGQPTQIDDASFIADANLIDAKLNDVQQMGSPLNPITGFGLNGFDSATGTIFLSQSYADTYFKVIYTK